MSRKSSAPSAPIGSIPTGPGTPLLLIAGPCVVEGGKTTLRIAEEIQRICAKRRVSLVFKASYRKANRTSLKNFATIGVSEALRILKEVRKATGLPVLTDVHECAEVPAAAEAADLLQIPALLCRQTDLLVAAGKSGKPVNIKKGPFLSPHEMRYAAEKVASTGNRRILLTERGTMFGYQNLVVDLRSIPIMQKTGYPVMLDVTHAVQRPGGGEGESAGEPEFIPTLARAGVAVGCDGLFIEVHPEPLRAPSDGSCMLPLDQLAPLLDEVLPLRERSRQTAKKG
jgi:2-dehydro-3-deoxyphosphooctonate aldolase (KDO 8-P synthase)